MCVSMHETNWVPVFDNRGSLRKRCMPTSQKEHPDWKTQSIPTTPLQRGAYLANCAHWIVNGSMKEEKQTSQSEVLTFFTEPTCAPMDVVDCASRFMVYTLAEITSEKQSVCSFCGEKKGSLVLANPFSHKCCTFVCKACSMGGTTP